MFPVALSLVEREDGAILAVWNRTWGGWCLPGGKVEEGETLADGQYRELKEETGLHTYKRLFVYSKPSAVDSSKLCHVFVVGTEGRAGPVEINSGVAWLTREYLIQHGGPFAQWMTDMFAELDERKLKTQEARNGIVQESARTSDTGDGSASLDAEPPRDRI